MVTWRRRALILVTMVTLGVACQGAAASPPIGTDIVGDTFYQPPSPLPAGQPGDLIRTEEVAAPSGSRAWRVLYHSRSTYGADIAVSGLVVAPSSPAAPGSRPVVAWGHGTVGSADRCAPSRQSDPIAQVAGLSRLVQAGAVIAASDYEGLGGPGPHPYLVGASEGRSVLDAARAAEHLSASGAGDRVVVAGYSQGGQAGLFASELAPSYAPDLRLLGTAVAAPAVDVSSLAASAEHHRGDTGLIVAAVAGYAAVDPTADPGTVLTAAGRSRLHLVIADGCNDQALASYAHLGMWGTFSTDPLTTEPWARGWRRDSTLDGVNGPVLIVQGGRDALVPQATTSALVRQLCHQNATVAYRVYNSATHASIPVASSVDVMAWIAARVAGLPVPTTC